MDKDQRDGTIFDSTFHGLTGGDRAAIYCSFKEVSGFNNLVLAVQVDNLQDLVTTTETRSPSG